MASSQTLCPRAKNMVIILLLRRRLSLCGPGRSSSCSEPIRELGESGYNQVGCRVRVRIGGTRWSPFGRAVDESCPVALATSGIEIEIVTCDHQDVARCGLEELCGAPVGLRPRLIDAEHLARDHRVPSDCIAARYVDDQRQAEDRERHADVALPQAQQ